jgi:hypothetical protein
MRAMQRVPPNRDKQLALMPAIAHASTRSKNWAPA